MLIKTAEFVCSNTQLGKCPKPTMPEYAFIGRSNVGKSSLINMLTNRKSLAKTSGKPGKTQLINHFIINNEWFMVDLPGYGYAKVSKELRGKWEKFIDNYINKRESLMTVFVLVDSSIPPQKIDLEFIYKLGLNEIPFSIIFTKTDRASKSKININIEDFKKQMQEKWEELPEMFYSSATKKNGKEEILKYIEKTNMLF